MNYYYLTEKFTLIPDMFFTKKGANHALRESHRLNQTDAIQECHLKAFHAHLIYALPSDLNEKKSQKEILPLAAYLAEQIYLLPEHNKVIFHYSNKHHLAHVLISKGERLQLINAYTVWNFESAVYFLSLAIKQTIVNPLQTKLHVYTELTEKETQILRNYFQEVLINNISPTITLL